MDYRAALNTIQNLKKILSSTKDEPSPELLVHFKVQFITHHVHVFNFIL